MPKEYWRTVGFNGASADLEFRASLALKLVEHFGLVAAKRPEGALDTTDPGVTLLQPEALVARCFAIADVFVDTAESRGAIRSVDHAAEKKQMDDLEAQRFEEMTQRRSERRAAQEKAGE
jgi:hypothetical protein